MFLTFASLLFPKQGSSARTADCQISQDRRIRQEDLHRVEARILRSKSLKRILADSGIFGALPSLVAIWQADEG